MEIKPVDTKPVETMEPVRTRRAVRATWLAVGAVSLALLAGLLVLPWMWIALVRAVDAPAAPAPVSAAPPEPRIAPPPTRLPVVVAAADDPAPGTEARDEMRDDPGPGTLAGEPEIVIVSDEEERDAPYVPQAIPYEGPTGMELFPPVGSKPLRDGIVVPDDFELPEGFVRHHQVTDDGEELPPILVFHPDYELRDANGALIDTTDRVVPPELAPEGLPIEFLDPPENEHPDG